MALGASERLQGPATLARTASGWVIAIGVVFITLGFLAIGEPMVAGLAVAALAGWVLVAAGVVHLVGAFADGLGRAFGQLLVGLVYLAAGIYCLMHPLLALDTLTLFLAGVLLAEAVLGLLTYARLRSEGGAGWLAVNALVTFFLGAMIWRHWPSSSAWAIGTLIGVNLLMAGFAKLMLGLTIRRITA